jgi:hypothetical protein
MKRRTLLASLLLCLAPLAFAAAEDKPTVIALREIAAQKVGKELLNPPTPSAPVL